MRLIIIICFIAVSNFLHGQKPNVVLRLYSKTIDSKDTTYYCSIVKGDRGYSFVFPEDTMIAYRQVNQNDLKFDTILLKSQSVFGPYKFKRKNGKIMFRDVERSKKFEDLYEIKKRIFIRRNYFRVIQTVIAFYQR